MNSNYNFLFKQLVKYNFKKRYKGTVLGMIWSILYPLFDLVILVLVFTKLLGRNTLHYPIYVFSGTLLMAYFREATRDGMTCFRNNRSLITKVKMPNYLLLVSKNVSSLINFFLTLAIFILLCIIDGISIQLTFILLLFPIICISLFNIGIGFVLGTCYVFFRDVSYIYDLLLIIINYLSATFYNVSSFSPSIQRLFLCNPIYCFIRYFRIIVIENSVPSIGLHVLCLFYALFYLGMGILVYKKNKKKFIYNL